MSKTIEAIAGSILFTLILIIGINMGGDVIDSMVTPKAPEAAQAEQAATAPAPVAAETPAAPEAAAPAETAAAPAEQSEGIEALAPEPIVPLLAAADAVKGEAVAKKCKACHTFEEGGPNRVGPNLHGVVGRDIAAHEGFSYSQILQTLPGEWSYEKLDAFLLNPKAAAPGTKMAFAGVKDQQERADLIAYLRSLSPNAPPLE